MPHNKHTGKLLELRLKTHTAHTKTVTTKTRVNTKGRFTTATLESGSVSGAGG